MNEVKTFLYVFCPFLMPISSEFDSDLLRELIDQPLADWKVKIIDLNSWAFKRNLQRRSRKDYSTSLNIFPEGQLGDIIISQALNIFNNLKDPLEVYNLHRLNPLYLQLFQQSTEIFLNELTTISLTYNDECTLATLTDEFLNLIESEQPDCVKILMFSLEQLPIGTFLEKLIRERTNISVIEDRSVFIDQDLTTVEKIENFQ